MPRSKLSAMSIADLRQEIERRQKLLPKLIAQRDALNRDIAVLQGLEAAKVGKPVEPKAPDKAGRRQQAKNAIGLAQALELFMKGKEKVAVGEAMEGVLAGGYRSNARDFRGLVNNMLLKDGRFKNVGRGQFALKA